MRLDSAATPVTVNDDEPLIIHSLKKGKGKVRVIHEPGDLPLYLGKELSEGKITNVFNKIGLCSVLYLLITVGESLLFFYIKTPRKTKIPIKLSYT